MSFMGTGGRRGKPHQAFDRVMELNLEFGAASTKLNAAQKINNAVVTDLFKSAKR